MLKRAGYTVVEMAASLVLTAIVVAGVGALGFRQQRFHRDVVAASEHIVRLEEATGLVPIVLRSIAPGEGDIPPGGARDTSLEFRATIATAVVCDSGATSMILAPTRTASPRLASILSRPDVGDTVWSLVVGPSDTWVPRAITSVADSVASCLLGGVTPWWPPPTGPSLLLRLAAPSPAGRGTPVRITRSWRYSLYRASDGDWYLGAREWNSGSLKFNTIQPVSGPFASAASAGMSIKYFDSLGAPLASAASDARGTALIQIAFRADSSLPGRFPHAIGATGSAMTRVAVRNRR